MHGEPANTQRALVAKLARDILNRAWRLDSGVWPTAESAVQDLLPIPTDRIARNLFGLDVETVPSIPSERPGFDISAMLDFRGRKVTLANGPTHSIGEQHLSLAHELYHYIKHKGLLPIVYRERISKNIGANDWRRPPMERDADWFAIEFTMPERRVNQAFHDRFGIPLSLDQIDEQWAFWLEAGTGKRLSASSIRTRGIDYLRYLVATCKWSGGTGRYYDSLTDLFRVTPTAMSIRLRELGFVREAQPGNSG